MRTPGLVAHRFGRSLGPDSSRSALSRLDFTTVAGVETDCCLTADGDIVLVHDDLLSAGTELDGWVRDRPAKEVREARLRDASGALTDDRVLTLEEGLGLVAGHVPLIQLEVKAAVDVRLAELTATALCSRLDVRALVEQIEVIAFWPRAVEVAAAAGFRTRLIVAAAYEPDALAAWATRNRVTGVILEAHYWAAEPVDVWRAAGLSVMSGVVNQEAIFERVLAFHPDLVATDRPHELHQLLAETHAR